MHYTLIPLSMRKMRIRGKNENYNPVNKKCEITSFINAY